MKQQTPERRVTMPCPHCGGRMITRSSRGLTDLVRQAQLQCVNLDCGASFGAQLAITHAIAASRAPNPDVMLPTATPRTRLAPANDEFANDNAGQAETTIAAD